MDGGSGNVTATFLPLRSALTYRDFGWKDVCLILLLVGGTHFAYRISIIGMPPFTDGGAHACFGYFARSGQASVPYYPINLYPAIVSAAGFDQDAPLFRPRLIDAFFCAMSVSATALLLFRLAGRWPAVLLGLIWSTAWLQITIGNAGFKNAIIPAFGLISASLLLWTYRSRLPLLLGGALIPLIPLVREPMAMSAVLLFAACLLLQGWRGVKLSFVGGMVSGILLLSWVCLFRGSPNEILAGYRDIGRMFSQFAAVYCPSHGDSVRAALDSGWHAGRALALSGLLGAVLFVAAGIRTHKLTDWQLLAIAGLLVLAPAVEIAFKTPFPYHSIQLGLGLLVLATLGCRALERTVTFRAMPTGKWLGQAALLGLLCYQLSINRSELGESIDQSKQFAAVMVDGDWDDESVSQSFYLRAAKIIRDHTDEGDTIFVSGFYYALYPLSQRLPADFRCHDATFASLAGMHESRAEDLIPSFRSNPPNVVVESLRMEDVRGRIRQFIGDFPDNYELVAELPNTLPIHYGTFGARIWQRSETSEQAQSRLARRQITN